ncbi:hypothetical protein BDV93DRAFT_522948 [Ceratobasidium sp. AG-I]|nr:hypothetical protein BDV93DRAFT_522948 [Ceratobasidium sp. AG-I]
MSTSTSSEVSPTTLDIVESLTKISQVLSATIFLAIASLCVMVYDAIITIDQEIKFVWCQKWSFGKAMYILIKYSSIVLMTGHVVSMLIHNPSLKVCYVVEEIFIWWQVGLLIAGSSVLIVRTWLLWGGKKWFLALLLLGLIAVSAPSIFFVVVDIATLSIVPNPAPNLFPGCLVKLPVTAWHPFVFPLVYETTIIVLTVTKAMQLRSRTPVAMRLFRDGTLYYVVIIAVLLITTIGAAHTRLRTVVLGSGYHIASISVGCSRLFLSLHSWSYEQKHPSTPTDPRPSSSLSGQSRKSTTILLKGASQIEGEYELGVRGVSDIESARAGSKKPEGETIIIGLMEGPVVRTHSMLPDIERPSLPERMWSTLPGSHARQQQQQQEKQRFSRPPRSSSLYMNGYVPDTQRRSGSREQVGRVEEVDEPSGGLDEREGTSRKYNMV